MDISGKEMLKLFLKAGWIKVRQRGSHVTLVKEGRGHIVIPVHNKALGQGLAHKILKVLEDK